MGTREIRFEVQRNRASTGKISSSVSFHMYFQLLHIRTNICFRRLMLLEMIFFEIVDIYHSRTEVFDTM